METEVYLKWGLQIAGVSQFALCVGSLAIPHCLKWNERTASLIPLMKQMFYTYAVYIFGSHLFFAFVSFFLADDLLVGDGLSIALLFGMGTWWSGRIICQFFFFDREGIPANSFNKVAEFLLVLMFFCLVFVYYGGLVWVWMK